MSIENSNLEELGGSNFKIVEGQPNIKGWTVRDGEGRVIGEVDELLFDPHTRKVRYLVIDLEGNVLDLEDKDIVVPVGIAELHENDDEVILPAVTREQLNALPQYDDNYFSPATENKIRQVFSSSGTSEAGPGSSFYEHEHFHEENLYKRRIRNTSGLNDDASRTDGGAGNSESL